MPVETLQVQTGAWFEVGDHCAREKVSSLLRDLLHTSIPIVRQGQARPSPEHWEEAKRHQNSQSGQNQAKELKTRMIAQRRRRAGECENSLGFEYWLEESDDFFDIDVFKIDWLNEARLILTAS
jgi:hypothetical protein